MTPEQFRTWAIEQLDAMLGDPLLIASAEQKALLAAERAWLAQANIAVVEALQSFYVSPVP